MATDELSSPPSTCRTLVLKIRGGFIALVKKKTRGNYCSTNDGEDFQAPEPIVRFESTHRMMDEHRGPSTSVKQTWQWPPVPCHRALLRIKVTRIQGPAEKRIHWNGPTGARPLHLSPLEPLLNYKRVSELIARLHLAPGTALSLPSPNHS